MISLSEHFAGKSLLVTGSTGFLAKALVAKVLRDLPDVERIVLLLRPRRRGGRRIPVAERLEREVLGSSAFRRLRTELGEGFRDHVDRRVVAVDGDLTRDGFGLAAEDERIVAGVDLVLNSAATVVFDEKLDHALELNTLGPLRLLRLARELGGRPFLHVSTAYVSGRRSDLIEEEEPSLTRSVADELEGREAGTLDLDAELEHLRSLCRQARDEARESGLERRLARGLPEGDGEALEEARARWLKDRLVELGMERARDRGWNDTYTYTKSLGERLLVRERGDVPVAILRPSIIESGLREPEPGWIDGLRMADPLFAAYGKGILRDFPADPDALIDFIPVDHVVNAALTALAHLSIERPTGSTPVYHVATSNANPLRFGRLFELTRTYFLENPLKDRRGRPIRPASWGFTAPRTFLRRMRRRTALLDTTLAVLRRLPRGLGARTRQRVARTRAHLDRLLYYVRIYEPYCNFHARFETVRCKALQDWLGEGDRRRFPFDAQAIDWREYVQDVHLPGLLRNVLREPAPLPLAHSSATAGEPAEAPGAGRGIADAFAEAAALHGERTALRLRGDDGSVSDEWTLAELHERVLGTAAALREAGVAAGERVVLQSENRPEWVAGWLGAVAAGGVVVPLDAQADDARLADVARFTEARVVLRSRRLATCETPGAATLELERIASRRLAAEEAAELGLPAAVARESPASILFTSGTTVDPRGVVLSHRAFLGNVDSIRQVLQPGPEDRLVSILPLHHAFEFTAGMLAPLLAGASITYLESASGPALVEAMRREKATVLLGVPRLYELLLDGIRRQVSELSGGRGAALGALVGTSRAFSAVGVPAGKALLAPVRARFGGKVRAFVSGGAALDPRVHEEMTSLGFTLLEGYGLTETAPVVAVNPPARPRAGTVGKPLPGVEVRIERPGEDGVGEIVVRGDNVMSGYYRNPEATERVLRDGWFRTGDLGRFDAEGYLHVTGRLKDLIVTPAGKNVHPDEVEAALVALPGVRESCVVGGPSRRGTGEEVHLVVVPEDGASVEEIKAEVSRRMAALPPHQRVQRVHAWSEELPKTRLMKVQRARLRARLAGEDETSSSSAAGSPASSDHEGVREVSALLARLAKVPAETLREDQHLSYDLGVDSLMLAEVTAAIEARAGRHPALEGAEISTVRDLVRLVHRVEPQGAGRASGRAAARAARSEASATSPAGASAESSAGGNGRPSEAAGVNGVRAGVPTRLISHAAAPLVRAAWPTFYGQYLKLEVSGRQYLPLEGAYILAANHQSHLDSGAILTALGGAARRLHVVAARDYFFDTPLKSSFFGALFNAIPFDRHGDYEPGLALCRRALESGDALLIFPEGTRSTDGRLQEFKAGLGLLAIELDVPVVPTRIEGTHEALPKGGRFPKRRPVRVAFGHPLDPATFAGADGSLPYERYRELVDAVRHHIAGLAARGAETPTAPA